MTKTAFMFSLAFTISKILLICSQNNANCFTIQDGITISPKKTIITSTTKLKVQDDQNNTNNNFHNSQTNQSLRAKSLPNKHLLRRIYLHRPVGIVNQYDDTYLRVNSYHRHQTQLQISSGLTFDDGDQLLVSAQKPLGMVLEEREKGEKGCVVASVVQDGAAYRAGVKVGDLLVAVQNADVGNADFEEVMSRISNAPKVVNLRFWRCER